MALQHPRHSTDRAHDRTEIMDRKGKMRAKDMGVEIGLKRVGSDESLIDIMGILNSSQQSSAVDIRPARSRPVYPSPSKKQCPREDNHTIDLDTTRSPSRPTIGPNLRELSPEPVMFNQSVSRKCSRNPNPPLAAPDTDQRHDYTRSPDSYLGPKRQRPSSPTLSERARDDQRHQSKVIASRSTDDDYFPYGSNHASSSSSSNTSAPRNLAQPTSPLISYSPVRLPAIGPDRPLTPIEISSPSFSHPAVQSSTTSAVAEPPWSTSRHASIPPRDTAVTGTVATPGSILESTREYMDQELPTDTVDPPDSRRPWIIFEHTDPEAGPSTVSSARQSEYTPSLPPQEVAPGSTSSLQASPDFTSSYHPPEAEVASTSPPPKGPEHPPPDRPKGIEIAYTSSPPPLFDSIYKEDRPLGEEEMPFLPSTMICEPPPGPSPQSEQDTIYSRIAESHDEIPRLPDEPETGQTVDPQHTHECLTPSPHHATDATSPGKIPIHKRYPSPPNVYPPRASPLKRQKPNTSTPRPRKARRSRGSCGSTTSKRAGRHKRITSSRGISFPGQLDHDATGRRDVTQLEAIDLPWLLRDMSKPVDADPSPDTSQSEGSASPTVSPTSSDPSPLADAAQLYVCTPLGIPERHSNVTPLRAAFHLATREPQTPVARSSWQTPEALDHRERRVTVTREPVVEGPMTQEMTYMSQEPVARDRFDGTRRPFTTVAMPPINPRTINSIDVSAAICNTQARHDLLFGEVILPHDYTVASAHLGHLGQLTTSTVGSAHTPDVIRLSKARYTNLTLMNSMYWDTVEHEIKTGCRCLRWSIDFTSDASEDLYSTITAVERIEDCRCGQWLSESSEASWQNVLAVPGGYPARLPTVLAALRDIIKLLMGSTEPLNHGTDPRSRMRARVDPERARRHAYTRTVVWNLLDALDPGTIVTEIRNGAFNMDLFAEIGRAMKMHCAPIRDAMVDGMVQLSVNGDIGGALRRCFECAEAMKVDIVNHQIYGLRSWLWRNAPYYERMSFERYLAAAGVHLQQSATRDWLYSASQRVLAKCSAAEIPHLEGRCACNSRAELVCRSIAEGLCTLVFAEWTGKDKCAWKIATSDTSADPAAYPIPESFRMDTTRIWAYSREVGSLTRSAVIMFGFRTLLSKHNPGLSSDEVKELHSAAWTTFEQSRSKGADFYTRKLSDKETRTILASDLGAVIAFPATAKESESPEEPLHTSAAMARHGTISDELDRFIASGINPTSGLFKMTRDRLRVLVHHLIVSHLMTRRYSDYIDFFPPIKRSFPGCCAGLDATTADIMVKDDDDAVETSLASESDTSSLLDPAVDMDSATGSAIRGSSASRLRLLYKDAVDKARIEELALFKKFGFELLTDRIRDLMINIDRIVHLNMCVFKDIYATRGMVHGSGTVSEAEMVLEQRRRYERNNLMRASPIYYTQ